MADSRKPYPKGPKQLVTDEWLQRVDAALAANKAANRAPSSRAELVELVANKSSMSSLWGTKTKKRSQTSKLVEPISALLGLDADAHQVHETPAPRPQLSYEEETIRRNLIAFRKERKLTPEQVIETVGIDVTDYENGAAIPASKLGKLADLYWHSVDDFRLSAPPKADPKRARGVYLAAEPDVDFPREEYERIQKQIDEARARWIAAGKTKKA